MKKFLSKLKDLLEGLKFLGSATLYKDQLDHILSYWKSVDEQYFNIISDIISRYPEMQQILDENGIELPIKEEYVLHFGISTNNNFIDRLTEE